MGLDVIEVLMKIEERFGVTIPDDKAQEMVAVGHLYLFLLKDTRRNMPTGCPTSRAFYRLRRTLTQEFAVERKRVVPSALMRDLIPPNIRQEAWPQLASRLELSE